MCYDACHRREFMMVEYKIDLQSNSTATKHIKDMDAVLSEIANTYEVILEVLSQQETALSSPIIDGFRRELKEQIEDAMDLSAKIVDNSRKLVLISEQASKQLSAMEETFNTTLERHATRVGRSYTV